MSKITVNCPEVNREFPEVKLNQKYFVVVWERSKIYDRNEYQIIEMYLLGVGYLNGTGCFYFVYSDDLHDNFLYSAKYKNTIRRFFTFPPDAEKGKVWSTRELAKQELCRILEEEVAERIKNIK